MFYLVYLLIRIGFAFVAANAAKEKGKSGVAFWLIGFFLGFIVAIAIIGFMQDEREEKPEIEGEEKILLKDNFLGKYLVFILLSLLMGSAFVWFTFSGIPITHSRITEKVIMVASYMAIIGFSVVVSTKARGIDLSIPAVYGMGGMIFGALSQNIGLVPAAIMVILLCAVVGLIQGIIIEYVKVPPILLTLVTGTFLAAFGRIMLQGQTVGIPMEPFFKTDGFFILVLALALAITIGLMFTKIGTPKHQRDDKSSFMYAAAYSFTSVLACIAGILYVFRLNAASPIMDKGWTTIIVIFFAVVSATRLSMKRWVAPLMIIGTAIILAYRSYALSTAVVDVFFQDILTGLVTVAFIVIMFLGRKKEYKYKLES
ncbi:MAG: hypothetical protein AB1Z23_01005 [Eubacteriales bacterium]